MDTQRIGIFFGDQQDALSGQLPLDKIVKTLEGDPSLFVTRITKSFENGGRSEIADLCREHDLAAAVFGGPTDQEFFELPLATDGESSTTIPLIRANLLERGAWLGKDESQAVDRVERQLRIAVAKARRARPIPLATRPVNRRVMVIGGNHGAYQSARNLSQAGLQVLLLKTSQPSGCFFPLTDDLEKSVAGDGNIEIRETAELSRIDGQTGDFHVEAILNGKRERFDVGAVVVAIDARVVEDGIAPEGPIVSLRGFMKQQAATKDGGLNIAVLLDKNGPERRCAAEASLACAHENVRRGGKSTILFRNMPVYGKNGQKHYDEARAAGVQFLRYDEIEPEFKAEGGKLEATMVDSMVPDRAFKFVIDHLIQPAPVQPRLENPALASILRQPLDREGFLQPGNIRHLPVSSARRGILFAGGCHNDCDPFEVRYESDAVTSQILALLPEAPVSAPLEIVRVDQSKCASCLTCLRLCPHGAIESYLEHKSVTILSSACWECGICAAACPGQAIEHGSLSHDQLDDVLSVATEALGEQKPTLVFACQQSAVPSLNSAGRLGLTIPAEASIVEVPCAGRIDEGAMMDALARGAERVLVMGCHPEVCRSLKGNLLAEKRVNRIRAMLKESGLDPEKVQYHPIANNEPYRLVHILDHVIHPETQPAASAETTN